MLETSNLRIAVLIDADNAQASIARELLAEVSKFGTATVKRAYGDWTTTNLKGWKDALLRLAIQPIQQFSYTTGKNSTDASLIIDAMDLLHSGKVDGFALVSSDSDFTRLATRIRESGLLVFGFGEKKTPNPFVAACDKFIATEILRSTVAQPAKHSPKAKKEVPAAPRDALEDLIRSAITAAMRDDGYAPLSIVGGLMTKNDPAFDSRHFGCEKLGDLMRKQPYVEVQRASGDKPGAGLVQVRLKELAARDAR
jgi:uncharacterized LabA/DUF88 family protein